MRNGLANSPMKQKSAKSSTDGLLNPDGTQDFNAEKKAECQ